MTDPTTPKLAANRLCYTDGRDVACDGAAGRLMTSGTLAITNISVTGFTASGAASVGSLGTGSIAASGSVSATTISTTALQIISQTTNLTACNASNAGTLRYNSPTTTLELCTGSGWQPMGVGVPAGTIAAFASTTCPTGWSEYTAARGRFLRGIDNGAGNDPDGTRAPGATQADLVGAHTHTLRIGQTYGSGGLIGWNIATTSSYTDAENNIMSSGGAETRPKNVAVTFCVFNGTSNGWNNPLSGSSASAAGGTGEVQYNAGSGTFGSSGNLTYSSGVLKAPTVSTTNVSATAITAAGAVQVGGTGAETCGSTDKGKMRVNPTSGRIQVCR